MQVGDSAAQVLRQDAAEKYLGRKLSFGGHQHVEQENRIAAAWAAFHKHKGELCNKHYRLRDRIKLFEAVVTPTALYGCSAWALTSKMEDKFKATRRKMLRYVFRFHWRMSGANTESWVEYMHRSAKQVDEFSAAHFMEDWTRQYRRKTWTFAGRTARREDQRWSTRMIKWLPFDGYGRSRGRPKTR